VAHTLRALARAVRRSYYRLHARGLPLVYDRRYQRSFTGVPLDPLRGEKIVGALDETGLLSHALLSEPRPVSLHNVMLVHTPEYLQALQEPETLTRILGIEVLPEEVEPTLDLHRLMTGGTIQATRLALRTGGVAVHLGGGFHHASAGSGLGFCVFNDIAIAIRRLRARGFDEPVLVVDLDLHDGNGTRRIFAEDASVHTLSIHNQHWGETDDTVASTSVALGTDVEDARYLEVIHEALPPVFERVRPGLVLYVAGTDPAADDAIGDWRLSAAALIERDRLVTRLARREGRACPLVVLLAGGYGRHAWRYTARYLLWLASGREHEPVAEEALALERFRRLGRELRFAESVDDGLPFALREEDLSALVPGAPRTARFLGYFSRHGVELLLERAGVLAQLRAKGFRTLAVELDGRDESGGTLRIVCTDGAGAASGGTGSAARAASGGVGTGTAAGTTHGGREILVELRAVRSRRAVPEMEVIAIDWLLLQNPRERFSERRQRLPGQQHPGLGLLRDFMGWLVVVCETHALDGVWFVAAHYHIAVQSRRVVRPSRPEDEARLSAMSEALAGLSLPEATRAVEEGRLVDARGDAVPWEPIETVLPVSERLAKLVTGAGYDEAVARHREALAYRLAPRRQSARSV
jgi:acetoin utilization deacetylase AcuC-like enzyme